MTTMSLLNSYPQSYPHIGRARRPTETRVGLESCEQFKLNQRFSSAIRALST